MGFDSASVVQRRLSGSSHGSFYSSDIIKWGEDNLLPQRINAAILESPTAGGCTRFFNEITYGNGISGELGAVVVNRHGDTLNDILEYSISDGYSRFYFFVLHFNFNILGEITEIFSIDPTLARKSRDSSKVHIKDWASPDNIGHDDLVFDMFNGPVGPLVGMRRDGLKKYRGQVYCYQRSKNRAYPNCPLAQSLQSVCYEDTAQTAMLAGAMNGFAPKSIIKFPVVGADNKDAKKKFKEFKDNLTDFSGPENSGRSIVTMLDMTSTDEFKPFQMVESIGQPGDTVMGSYSKLCAGNIMTSMIIPRILLGNPESGLFTESAYNEAYNVKVSHSLYDQSRISRAFTDIISKSVWKDYGEVLILPKEKL